MTAFDADPLLRRLERTALAFCLAAAGLAAVMGGGRIDVAAGILAGGVLIGVSYWAIRGGVDGLVRLAGGAATSAENRPRSRRQAAVTLVRLTGRYALLALLAYVMIARLRLHPIGLLVGVSSVVVAAGVEAVRMLALPGRAGRR